MNWKKLIKQVAPTLGTALAGPVGGIAVKFLADALIPGSDNPEDALRELISQNDPSVLLKIKELDNAFKIDMERLGIDVFALEIQDRQGARDMAKDNMWPQIVLSAIFIIGYFGLLFMFHSS